jgi:anaerobic ribonucleoside-triphosphate reductase activating protein
MGEDGGVLRLHRFLPRSRSNGPGLRAVIWVQGCSLGCPGCFNPATHPTEGGRPVPVKTLFKEIAALEATVEGITVSGGEPLQQFRPVLALLRRVREETTLSALLFSGYSWPQVRQMDGADELLACLDVLVAGPYEASRHLARDLRGSANQTVHLLSERYTLEHLQAVPPAEVIIGEAGEVLLSGIDPLDWQVPFKR